MAYYHHRDAKAKPKANAFIRARAINPTILQPRRLKGVRAKNFAPEGVREAKAKAKAKAYRARALKSEFFLSRRLKREDSEKILSPRAHAPARARHKKSPPERDAPRGRV